MSKLIKAGVLIAVLFAILWALQARVGEQPLVRREKPVALDALK